MLEGGRKYGAEDDGTRGNDKHALSKISNLAEAVREDCKRTEEMLGRLLLQRNDA